MKLFGSHLPRNFLALAKPAFFLRNIKSENLSIQTKNEFSLLMMVHIEIDRTLETCKRHHLDEQSCGNKFCIIAPIAEFFFRRSSISQSRESQSAQNTAFFGVDVCVLFS